MKVSSCTVQKRLKVLEDAQDPYGDVITITYTDGRKEKKRETSSDRVDQVGCAVDWHRYIEGIISEPPPIRSVYNHNTRELWDFEAEAKRPPLTAEETERLFKELNKQ